MDDNNFQSSLTASLNNKDTQVKVYFKDSSTSKDNVINKVPPIETNDISIQERVSPASDRVSLVSEGDLLSLSVEDLDLNNNYFSIFSLESCGSIIQN